LRVIEKQFEGLKIRAVYVVGDINPTLRWKTLYNHVLKSDEKEDNHRER
jgi:hypothetical protein